MSEESLNRIEAILEMIVRLLATRVLDSKELEGKSQTEKIQALGTIGLETRVIADVLVATPATVRSALSKGRKAKPHKKKAK